MPGRKNPKPTEAEKTHDYRLFEKREAGEKLQGDLGEGLDEKGEVGEVRDERRAWRAKHPESQEHEPL